MSDCVDSEGCKIDARAFGDSNHEASTSLGKSKRPQFRDRGAEPSDFVISISSRSTKLSLFHPEHLIMPPRIPIPFLLPRAPKHLSPTSSPNDSPRAFSTSRPKSQEASPPTESNNARWLSQTKSRLGKCIIFGLNPEQTQKAGNVLKAIGEEWRELVAGREGFLTDKKRAGLLRQKVVWGEMDSMVCLLPRTLGQEGKEHGKLADRRNRITLTTLRISGMRRVLGSIGRITTLYITIPRTGRNGTSCAHRVAMG